MLVASFTHLRKNAFCHSGRLFTRNPNFEYRAAPVARPLVDVTEVENDIARLLE